MTINHHDIRQFSPFDQLNGEYLDKVIERTRLREVPKGTIIFKRGKALDEIFYLVSGQIDLIDSRFDIRSIDEQSEERRLPLNDNSPTQVSAMAKSPVVLLVVERDFLDLVLAWSESGGEEQPAVQEEGDWMSALLQAPLFSKIPPGNISQLFVRFDVLKAAADDIIVREGERGDYFYVLESGSAMVMDKSGNILAALRPGDFFGEEALVGETTRNATVKMLTPGKLRRLKKDDFKELLQQPVLHYVDWTALQARAETLPAVCLLDVRLPIERRIHAVPESRNIPLGYLRKQLADLNHDCLYAVTDDAGRRGDVAAQLLAQAGFEVCILQNACQCYPSH